MALITGELSGTQPTAIYPQIIGPYTFQESLTANTADVLRVAAVSTKQHRNTFWNYTYNPFLVRGMSGVVFANSVASGATVTLTAAGTISAIGGTETPANLAGGSYQFQGAFTGAFFWQPAGLLPMPFSRKVGNTFNINIVSTAAGNVDLIAYLHLEA